VEDEMMQHLREREAGRLAAIEAIIKFVEKSK
jgi:hypothetical protein